MEAQAENQSTNPGAVSDPGVTPAPLDKEAARKAELVARFKGKTFKKGKSGNPNGRPPKDKCATSMLRENWEKHPYESTVNGRLRYELDDRNGGVKSRYTWGELVVLQLYRQALVNPGSMRELLDRVEGKVKENIDVTSAGKRIEGHGYREIPDRCITDAFAILLNSPGVTVTPN